MSGEWPLAILIMNTTGCSIRTAAGIFPREICATEATHVSQVEEWIANLSYAIDRIDKAGATLRERVRPVSRDVVTTNGDKAVLEAAVVPLANSIRALAQRADQIAQRLEDTHAGIEL